MLSACETCEGILESAVCSQACPSFTEWNRVSSECTTSCGSMNLLMRRLSFLRVSVRRLILCCTVSIGLMQWSQNTIPNCLHHVRIGGGVTKISARRVLTPVVIVHFYRSFSHFSSNSVAATSTFLSLPRLIK